MTSGRGVCLFKEKAGSRKLIKVRLQGSEGELWWTDRKTKRN